MFGIMRSSSQRKSSPCPCDGKCRCHKLSKWTWKDTAMAITGILFVFSIPFVILFTVPKPQKRTIHVGNQICDIEFKITETHCTMTCHNHGYDVAVCPNSVSP